MASSSFVTQHGMNQQTGAVQHLIRKATGAVSSSTGSRKRKRKTSSAAGSSPKRRAKRSSGGSRKGKTNKLVAGSSAAKAWGAKMKRLRKKK